MVELKKGIQKTSKNLKHCKNLNHSKNFTACNAVNQLVMFSSGSLDLISSPMTEITRILLYVKSVMDIWGCTSKSQNSHKILIGQGEA